MFKKNDIVHTVLGTFKINSYDEVSKRYYVQDTEYIDDEFIAVGQSYPISKSYLADMLDK